MGNKQSSATAGGANVVEAPSGGAPSKREKICSELLQTEETYVRGLTTLDRYFRNALVQAGEKEKTISAIFSSVPSILGLHNTQMLPQLQLRCTATAPVKTRWCVAQVFLDFASQLGLYSVFINNYEEAVKKVMKIRKQKKEVAELFDNARVLQETNGLDFFSLFITIVQRLPRYVLMLQDLAKHVPTSDREHKLLTQAIATISTAAQEINERKAAFEDMNALGRLSADISSLPIKLNKPGRRIVESGEMQARHGTSESFKNCKFWLFNDSLLLARQQAALLGKLAKPWKLVHFSFLANTEFVNAGEDIVSIEAAKAKPLQVRVPGSAADWITKMYLARSRAPKKLKDASRSRMSFAQDSTPSGQIAIQPVPGEPGCQACLLQ